MPIIGVNAQEYENVDDYIPAGINEMVEDNNYSYDDDDSSNYKEENDYSNIDPVMNHHNTMVTGMKRQNILVMIIMNIHLIIMNTHKMIIQHIKIIILINHMVVTITTLLKNQKNLHALIQE